MFKQQFFDYLSFERRFSPNTLKAYRNDLQQFFSFLNEEYELSDVKDVNHQYIRSWIIELLTDQELSPSSVNRKISCLKSYFKFLMRNKVIQHNPMLKIVSPKKKKRLPSFVEEKAMMELFDDVAFDSGFVGLRDQLILHLFYATGIRLSELIDLKIKDVDFVKKEIKVLGKRQKERFVPVSDDLLVLFNNYLKEREFYDEQKEECVFLTEKGKTIYPKLVYNVVNKSLGEVTTLKKKSPHVLRHTFATHMLNNGADLNVIKEILGHSSLAATQVYTHNSFEKIKSIYNQAHPRA